MSELAILEPPAHMLEPQPQAAPHNPFARMLAAPAGANIGAIAIESERAIAEAQGQLTLAKRFPRSMAQAYSDFMEACKDADFAKAAFYSVPNRGSGPSIRFMEEAARCYGNFQYGHRELARSDGKSEVEVYAWDMEKNNRSIRQITVLHVRDTSNGPKKLVDQNDIDGRVANVASKQMRGRIAALMPKALVAAGIAQCRKTLAGESDKPVAQRVRDMIGAFAKYGATVKHLEEYLGHTLDTTTLDELVDLTGVFNAIKEGAKASDYFQVRDVADAATAEQITNQANRARAATPPAAPAKPSAPAQQPAESQEPRAETPQPAPAAPPPRPPAQQQAAVADDGDGAGPTPDPKPPARTAPPQRPQVKAVAKPAAAQTAPPAAAAPPPPAEPPPDDDPFAGTGDPGPRDDDVF